MRFDNIVLFTILFLASIANAQTSNVVDQSFTGDVGEDALDLSALTTVTVTGSSFTGGSGNSNPILGGDKPGGAGLITSGGEVTIRSSDFNGGTGGVSTVNSISIPTLDGGHGYVHSGTSIAINLDGSFMGGEGGIASNAFGAVKTHGGDGVHISDVSTSVIVNGGSFEGGDAGSSSLNSEYFATSYNRTYLDINGSHGGHGLRITRLDQVPDGDTLTIMGGTFIGGDGGVVTNTLTGLTTAQGGSGVFVDYTDVTIEGGDFTGGNAGKTNGVTDIQGAGLHAQDSNLIINDGTFNGLGLRYEARYYEVQNTINGGTFDQIEYISNYDDFLDTSNRVTTATINGGIIQELYLNGSTFNDISITGGEVQQKIYFNGNGSNELFVTGTSVVGDLVVSGLTRNELSLSSNVVSSGIVIHGSGTTDVNLWSDDHFTDTTVSGGVLNFNNQDFNLINGAQLRVTSTDAVVNFKGTNTAVKSGAQLDLGVGRTSANAFTVQSGGSVQSTVYGENGVVSMGSLEVEQLTVDAGSSWTLYNDGTFTDYGSLLNSNAFLLGVSSNTITSGLTSSDVELTGEGMDAFWLYGISDIVVISNGALNELYAQYGMKNLGDALNAEGDLLTLMNLMQVEVETNVDLQNILINYGSQDVASAAITAGFLRTAEMGSSLSGAQSVLADQIGLRTREHLRSFRLAGKTGPSGARGPASWWDRSMNRLHDALPNFNLRDSMRSAQDRMPEPSFSDERASVKKPWISGVQGGAIPSFNSEITIPSHYQTWGRAYVADLDQESTGGFAGYDASVRGGVLGVDRRFDHAVVGVAGGMGKTIVTGADGHSGEADSLQSMAYASYFTDRVYLNAHISYARSDVETEGVSDFGYRSEYDANNLSFFVGAGVGYKMFNDAVLITPEVSLLSSKYSRDGYTSSSSMSQTLGFEDMVFDSYDQWSYQSELGVAVSSMKLIENTRLQLALQPEFRVHWVHEFEPDPDAERYQLSGSTQLLHAQLQSREENLIRLGGGVRCWNWNSQTTEFGLNLDHLKGDAYTEWMFSGHFVHRF